ncbi:iron-containing alcohol dehydrogenase [Pseudomonas sp. NPDC007930]|uniref:iron-containing alcohol dehydrogenase n=1 Tax=Pseudomonas sp. NPDC007930 TaxID=3364417 RepID=UPI0036DFEE6C
MPGIQVFTHINRLVQGRGAVAQLAEEVARFQARKVLVVTDPGLVATGIPARVVEALGGYSTHVYSDVEPDPSIQTVERCTAFVRQQGFDLVIGLGGGSAIDTAKCAAALASNEGAVESYLGIEKIPAAGLPKIIIPTTAGTGSEVTNVAVLSLKDQHTKKGIVSRQLFADVAILDPELTLGLPAAITAATGMDALTHAIEAYVSRFHQPLTDHFALEAIRLIGAHLRTAVHHGENLDAREAMLTASLYAGLAFGSAATGMVHGLAMPLGGQFEVPHGVANAMLLPYVMRFNLVAALERYRDIAVALGEPVAGLSVRDGAERSLSAVRQLAHDVGIPTLREMNIPPSAIDALARDGLSNSRQVLPNPRKVTYEGLVGILEEAFAAPASR